MTMEETSLRGFSYLILLNTSVDGRRIIVRKMNISTKRYQIVIQTFMSLSVQRVPLTQHYE